MPRERISEEVHRFILITIPSVPFLEAMLVYRSMPARPMDARDLAKRLYLGEASSIALQESLRQAGIIGPAEGEAGLRYAPATPELARLLDELAALYAKDLIVVTNIIHSKTGRKAQQFADAFKWRKDP